MIRFTEHDGAGRRRFRAAPFFMFDLRRNKLLFVGHVTVGSRHVHYGLIATGNHDDINSLRGAPPRPQPIDEYAEPLFTLPRISAKTYHSVFVTGSVEACLDPTKSVLEKDDTRNILMKTVRMLDTTKKSSACRGICWLSQKRKLAMRSRLQNEQG